MSGVPSPNGGHRVPERPKKKPWLKTGAEVDERASAHRGLAASKLRQLCFSAIACVEEFGFVAPEMKDPERFIVGAASCPNRHSRRQLFANAAIAASRVESHEKWRVTEQAAMSRPTPFPNRLPEL